MYIRSKTASAAFKALICIGGLTGILIQCGLLSGRPDLSCLRYYTLLSNALCTAYFGFSAVCAARGRETVLPRCKSAFLMGITVTGLVYNFMLSDSGFAMGGAMAFANFLLHSFVPVFSVLDWLLFDKKGRYTPLSPVEWVILPDAYFVLATVYGFTVGKPFYGGARFPYFFIDYDALGVWSVLAYVVVLNVLFVALGYIYYLIDRLMDRAARRRAEPAA